MEEWWSSLGLFMQSVWCITLFASLVFVVQTIMTFIGMDTDGGMDVDVSADTAIDGDSGPFQLFTFRNFINFLLGFGWSIISFEKAIENQFVLILVSAVIGVLLVMAVMAIFRFMSRMEQSGTINMANAVGCKGNVYLKIPGEKRGVLAGHVLKGDAGGFFHIHLGIGFANAADAADAAAALAQQTHYQ